MKSESTQPTPAAVPQRGAWQPFTPQGVAAFAGAGWGRLLAMLMLMGLGAGLVMMWFVRGAWFPPADKAVAALPLSGEIAGGRLLMDLPGPLPLAGNRYLALAIDLEHRGTVTPPADLQIELGATNLHLRGMLGYIEVRYPRAWHLPLNQRQAVPWWGAWKQAVLAGVWVAGTVGLMFIWIVLGFLYIPLARVVAWLRGVELGVSAAWRLCAASLMPGAVIMTAALWAYGWGLIDLVRLGLVAIFHVMVAWVYVPLSVLCLPRSKRPGKSPGNPFEAAKGC